MEMKRLSILLFIIFSIYSSAQSQTKKDQKRAYINGEFALIYEEYREALPYFLELYDGGRRDANIKHRIGYCYLNIPNQKDKAIVYLEDAVQNIQQAPSNLPDHVKRSIFRSATKLRIGMHC